MKQRNKKNSFFKAITRKSVQQRQAPNNRCFSQYRHESRFPIYRPRQTLVFKGKKHNGINAGFETAKNNIHCENDQIARGQCFIPYFSHSISFLIDWVDHIACWILRRLLLAILQAHAHTKWILIITFQSIAGCCGSIRCAKDTPS